MISGFQKRFRDFATRFSGFRYAAFGISLMLRFRIRRTSISKEDGGFAPSFINDYGIRDFQ